MSEWDAFDVYDHGPGDTVPDGDLDLGALDHGGPDLGELDHGALDAGLNASLDPGEHDPLLADPLADPLAEHAPVPAEPDWIYDPALGSGAPDMDPATEDLLGTEAPGQWDASLQMPEVISGDPFSELINETGPIEPGTPLWDTVMNVLALPGRDGEAWLQPGPDDFGTSV